MSIESEHTDINSPSLKLMVDDALRRFSEKEKIVNPETGKERGFFDYDAARETIEHVLAQDESLTLDDLFQTASNQTKVKPRDVFYEEGLNFQSMDEVGDFFNALGQTSINPGRVLEVWNEFETWGDAKKWTLQWIIAFELQERDRQRITEEEDRRLEQYGDR